MTQAAAPTTGDARTALEARARAMLDRGPAWLAAHRRGALERFAARGFPTTRDEDWKYTSLQPLARAAWTRPAPPDLARAREALGRLRLHLSGGLTLVLVDGIPVPELSVLPPGLAGISIRRLAEAAVARPEFVEPYLARVAAGGDRPLADLATACFEDGLYLHARRGTCLPVPVEVIHLTMTAGAAVFPRTLVVAEPESRITVVEHHVGLTDAPYATLPVVEVAVGRNAAVEHVLWQDDAASAVHAATVAVRQDRDSRFASHVLTLGAGLARNDLGVGLAGEGAECTLDGLYLVFGSRHADHHTRVDHWKPHGTSRELYKGVLDGQATGVFNGKVIVHPGAQKTDAQQANHNLLLSPDATADTKPELEIYADDVKCAHGATVGRLEEERLFYLRSRGLPEQAARDLLLRAFARDVTDRISIEAVRARLDRWMTERLPALAGREEGA